ncbi:MAG: hypothetical protein KatS3mg065_0970 [Chloroflexota bacterium]|nr:MAG: hypothetical protein KatS3mg065_0970 [Chloroflexota bacterium]
MTAVVKGSPPRLTVPVIPLLVGLLVAALWAASPVGLASGFGGFGATVVRAASPTPSLPAGDPRSPGQGPGFVGEPIVAIGLVLLVGILAVAVTLLYVRLVPGDGQDDRR